MVLNTAALLRDEHVDMITAILKRFVYKNPERLHLHMPQEVRVEYAKLKDVTVSSVSPITRRHGSKIDFKVELSAVIITGSKLDADGTLIPDLLIDCSQKFIVSCSGTLTDEQTLEKFWVGAIRVKVEKTFEEHGLWGILAAACQEKVKSVLSAHIAENPQNLLLPTPPWVQKIESASLCELEITHVGELTNLPGMDIRFEIIAAAEIEAMERTNRDSLQKSQYQQWFTLVCHENLETFLQDFSVERILLRAVQHQEGSPLWKLASYLQDNTIEAEAQAVLKEYGLQEAIDTPMAVDPARLVKRMGLTIQHRCLSKENDVFGAVVMEDCEVPFYHPDQDAVVPEPVPAGTVIVDERASLKRPIGSVNNTIIHECVHWHRHRKAYYLSRFITGRQPISCLVDGSITGGLTERLSGIEWQANALAPRIQMPYPAFTKKAGELIDAQRQEAPNAPLVDLLGAVIAELAAFFQVSRLSAKIRLVEVGYPEARGVLDYVDGQYLRPYAFAPGELGRNQTFTVSTEELAQLYDESEELRECLQSGEYTVVESHVCLNDPRYVSGAGNMLVLTEYARLHVDECCLKFAVERKEKNTEFGQYYSAGILYREEFFNTPVKLEIVEKAKKAKTRLSRESKIAKELAEEERAEEFSQTFTTYTDDIRLHLAAIKSGLRMMTTFSDAVRALLEWRGMSIYGLAACTHLEYRTLLYSVPANPEKEPEAAPNLDTVFRICIALQFPYPLSRRLLELAGYTLNDSELQLAYDFALLNFSTFPVQFCMDFIKGFKEQSEKKKDEGKKT